MFGGKRNEWIALLLGFSFGELCKSLTIYTNLIELRRDHIFVQVWENRKVMSVI